PRQVRLGREVQVGEQRLALAQHLHLPGLGLLDLEHELGLVEHRLRAGRDSRPLGAELLVAERAAFAGARLHEHFMTVRRELAHPRWRDRDAVLVRLDLGRYTYLQRVSSRPRSASQNSIRSRALPRSLPVSCSMRLTR